MAPPNVLREHKKNLSPLSFTLLPLIIHLPPPHIVIICLLLFLGNLISVRCKFYFTTSVWILSRLIWWKSLSKSHMHACEWTSEWERGSECKFIEIYANLIILVVRVEKGNSRNSLVNYLVVCLCHQEWLSGTRENHHSNSDNLIIN